jgi:hypothetical protein
MSQIQALHQEAMNLAESALTTKLKGDVAQADQLLRQAFEKEAQAAALTAHDLNAEPTRSVLHRSAASLAIDCGEFQVAERLIMTALAGEPPQEIAEELKDLFIQINLPLYVERHRAATENQSASNIFSQDQYHATSYPNEFVNNTSQQIAVLDYAPEERQSLAEAAAEIQQLFYQLAQTNTISTEVVISTIYQEIKRNPTLEAKLENTLKAGGLEALKAIFNHPLFSIPVETVKGWLEAE